MTKSMKRIHKVTIKRVTDDSPDTSWLGEYASSSTSEYSIDRAHDEDCPSFDNEDGDTCTCNFDGYWHNREYRYFNPSFNYIDKRGHALPENTPEDVRKYVRQDYERMESLNRGDWCFVGVRAEAQVSFGKVNGYSYLLQDVTSGGLWGIESDSGDYFKEVEAEQLSELRDQLHAIGFSQRAISAAFKEVQHKDE